MAFPAEAKATMGEVTVTMAFPAEAKATMGSHGLPGGGEAGGGTHGRGRGRLVLARLGWITWNAAGCAGHGYADELHPDGAASARSSVADGGDTKKP
jgi:hypothetical protein